MLYLDVLMPGRYWFWPRLERIVIALSAHATPLAARALRAAATSQRLRGALLARTPDRTLTLPLADVQGEASRAKREFKCTLHRSVYSLLGAFTSM